MTHIVKNLSHGLILGMDFLDETGAVVDCHRRIVTFDDGSDIGIHGMWRDYGDEPKAYMRALHTVCIPPPTEAYIAVSVPCRFNDSTVLLKSLLELYF